MITCPDHDHDDHGDDDWGDNEDYGDDDKEEGEELYAGFC